MLSMKKISLLCPTRQRPEHALRLALSIVRTANKPQRVEILFYIDLDDCARDKYVNLFRTCEYDLRSLLCCNLFIGERIGVFRAWNELARNSQGDIIIMAADDQIYNDIGWDSRLDQEVQKYPDEIFCMWFNDGYWQEKLCTFPIVSRKWCLTLGYFVSGLFERLYDDLWIMDLGMRVGRLHYIPDILTEHLHWAYGKGEYDATYAEQLGEKGELKPVVKRDRDLFARTSHYREVDAKKLVAVMSEPVTLMPGLSVGGSPSIFL